MTNEKNATPEDASQEATEQIPDLIPKAPPKLAAQGIKALRSPVRLTRAGFQEPAW